MIARLVGAYLGIFTLVLAAASFALYLFLSAQYHSLLLPALSTPEGASVYAQTMQKVAIEILVTDVPLLVLFGLAAWALARLSLRPLIEAQARERAFIADAAHELRSPLATIASVAQAARGDAAVKKDDVLDTIAKTALEASAMVGDLLTLARSPRPTLLQREPVDLAALARSSIREIESRAQRDGIKLELHLLPAIVDGDARRLRELLRNLLENALRHASSHITIVTGVEGGRAMLRVSDDGAGARAGIARAVVRSVCNREYRRQRLRPCNCAVGCARTRGDACARRPRTWSVVRCVISNNRRVTCEPKSALRHIRDMITLAALTLALTVANPVNIATCAVDPVVAVSSGDTVTQEIIATQIHISFVNHGSKPISSVAFAVDEDGHDEYDRRSWDVLARYHHLALLERRTHTGRRLLQRQFDPLRGRNLVDEPKRLGRHIRDMRHFLIGLALLALVPVLAHGAPAGSVVTVHLHGDAYMPPSITIHTGDTVRFVNDDDDAHTVTATDGSFDSKGMDTNGSWSHTFSRVGTYRYFCDLHPFMKGTVIVKDAKA